MNETMTGTSIHGRSGTNVPLEKVALETYVPPAKPSLVGFSRAQLTQALASNLDFRGILFTVVQRIAEVAKVDRVSIVLVREAGDVGYVVAVKRLLSCEQLVEYTSKCPNVRALVHGLAPCLLR